MERVAKNRNSSPPSANAGSSAVEMSPQGAMQNLVDDSLVLCRQGLQLRSVFGANQSMQRFSNSPVVQRATSISYETTEFDLEDGSSELVGKKMTANLDPTKPTKGSAPGRGVHAKLMGGLRAVGYKRMIRGHLLNGHMGGLGIAANLFPISSQANSKHKNHMENYVKEAVSKDKKEVVYTVEVENAACTLSSPNADFACTARATDGSWDHRETIRSEPGKTSSRGDNIEGSLGYDTDTKSFPSSNFSKGWGQRGKGYSSSNVAHTDAVGKSEFTHDSDVEDLDDSLYARGRNFDSGEINRQGYALELLEEYVSNGYNKWPIYFKGLGNVVGETEMENEIENSDDDIVERIIDRISGLL